MAAEFVRSAPVVADPSPQGGRRRFSVAIGPGKVRVASTLGGVEIGEDQSSRRGEVVEWSARSRLRMVETMASLDWGPVVAPDREGWRPAMVTLTLPGDWLAVAPDGPAFKALMRRFRGRWDRRWGTASWVWKLEFQRRGAPHLHIYSACGSELAFREWVSLAWTASIFGIRPRRREGERWDELVTRIETTYGEEVRKSLVAGAGIDWGEGIRASDPKRLAVYFLKRATGHNLGVDKEYQHRVPEAWREADSGPGRFWGYYGLDKCEREVAITHRDFVQLRRLLRRWSRANGRPLPWLGRARMSGGMVLANDAPGLIAQASRWLDTLDPEEEPPMAKRRQRKKSRWRKCSRCLDWYRRDTHHRCTAPPVDRT